MENSQRLQECILTKSDRVFEIQRALSAIPALGPENGGQGELAKAILLSRMLKDIGVPDQIRIDSPDSRVESGIRPNIAARLPGQRPQTLWLFGHLDVVPPGDASSWKSDPWKIERDGDLIYGRGVEDNQQAIASMLILAECLVHLRIIPRLSLGLVFMADEECGSRHGLERILQTRPELFQPDDLYIVPDGGSPNGDLIEIAEKAQLWIKFAVNGKQCHASMPQNGNNALVAASELICRLNRLGERFNEADPLFEPPQSTFVPTKQEANVPAINILPGKSIFYMDCRLLPSLPSEEVLREIKKISSSVESERGVKIEIEVVHSQPSSATPADAPVIAALDRAIASIYGVAARPVGIGGATVAAFLRQRGLPVAVWARIANTCHAPNECSSLSATCGDAAVFADILMGAE